MAVDPLTARAEGLREQLGLLEGALAPTEQIDPTVYARLQPIVADEVSRLQQQLVTTPLVPGAQAWAAVADLEDRVRRLAGEVLSLAGGMAARHTGLDGGLCAAADRLVGDVTTKLVLGAKGVTMPAAGEYLDLLSDVIRVRFPGNGVWDLPVVLHELGHFVAPLLGAKRAGGSPVAARIAEERDKRPNLGNFAEELFADTFATYVGGLAYGATCLLLRLNPSGAHADGKPTHPAPIKRAVAVLTTLDALEEARRSSGVAAGSLAPYVADLRATWTARLTSAGEAAEPAAEATEYASALATEFRVLLDDLAVVARFDDLGRASALVGVLSGPGPIESIDATMVDALNGGWMARRAAEVDDRADVVATITTRLTALCAKITAGG